jgi:hypothetical protein
MKFPWPNGEPCAYSLIIAFLDRDIFNEDVDIEKIVHSRSLGFAISSAFEMQVTGKHGYPL